jgi:hypothetical protein
MPEHSSAKLPTAPAASPPIFKLAVAVLLGSFCVFYWAEALHVGARQHLATDDVFTLWMIKSPSILGALKVGADTAPPAFYWLMKACCSLFGYTELGLRLPTIAATFVFVATTFLLLRKHVGSALAGAAAMIPLFGSAEGNALFARPPALMMATFALLCLVWEHDRSAKPKAWRSVAIAALLGFGISMHFYSVLFVPTMILLELVWSSEHRIIRKGHWAGIIGGACVLLLWLPVIGPIYRMTHASAKSPAYYAHPTPMHLLEYLRNIAFSPNLILLLIVLLLMGGLWRWMQIRSGSILPLRVLSPVSDNLGAVGFAAGVYPLLTYVFALIVTHVFNERYIVSCALGIGIALALLVRSLRWSRTFELALLVLVVAIYDKGALSAVRSQINPLAHFESVIQQIPGSEPIALPDGGSFFAAQQSADPQVRARTVYVFLPAGMSDADTEPGRIAKAWHTLRPELPITDNAAFLAQHKSFYILSWGTPGEGLVPWATANLHTEIAAVDGDVKLYHVTQ